jgi:hypothetical protein
MNRLLKAKHWQIFMLTYGLPFIFEIIWILFMIFGNNHYVMMRILPVIMIFFMAGFFGWFWAVAVGLQKKIPVGINLNIRNFKIFLLIPFIYIVLFLGFFALSLDRIQGNVQETNGSLIPGLFAIILPLHFFSMFCIIYCLYFVSKTIKTVELQRFVVFSDFAGEFLMLLIFPIGVWILQPRINKLVEIQD